MDESIEEANDQAAAEDVHADVVSDIAEQIAADTPDISAAEITITVLDELFGSK